MRQRPTQSHASFSPFSKRVATVVSGTLNCSRLQHSPTWSTNHNKRLSKAGKNTLVFKRTPKVASAHVKNQADRFIGELLRFADHDALAFRDVMVKADITPGLPWVPRMLFESHKIGLLAALAVRVFSIPASSDSIERIFFTCKWKKSDRRAALKPAMRDMPLAH